MLSSNSLAKRVVPFVWQKQIKHTIWKSLIPLKKDKLDNKASSYHWYNKQCFTHSKNNPQSSFEILASSLASKTIWPSVYLEHIIHWRFIRLSGYRHHVRLSEKWEKDMGIELSIYTY